MLRRFLAGSRHSDDVLEHVAARTEGATGADLEQVALYAARSSALRLSNTIDRADLQEALEEYQRRVDVATADGRP
jgi:ATP-dependent Zn protease